MDLTVRSVPLRSTRAAFITEFRDTAVSEFSTDDSGNVSPIHPSPVPTPFLPALAATPSDSRRELQENGTSTRSRPSASVAIPRSKVANRAPWRRASARR